MVRNLFGSLCFINLDEQKSLKSFNGRTDDLSYSVVSSFAEDEKFLWIGTEGGGLTGTTNKPGALPTSNIVLLKTASLTIIYRAFYTPTTNCG